MDIQIGIIGVTGAGKTHLIDAIQKVFSRKAPYLKSDSLCVDWDVTFMDEVIPGLTSPIAALNHDVDIKGLSANPTEDFGTLPYNLHSFSIRTTKDIRIVIKNIAGEFYKHYFKIEYNQYKLKSGSKYGYAIAIEYIHTSKKKHKDIYKLYNNKELFKTSKDDIIQELIEFRKGFLRFIIDLYEKNTGLKLTVPEKFSQEKDPDINQLIEMFPNQPEIVNLMQYFYTYLFVSSSDHLVFCYSMDEQKFDEQNYFLSSIRDNLGAWNISGKKMNLYCAIAQFDRIIEDIEFSDSSRLTSIEKYARLMSSVNDFFSKGYNSDLLTEDEDFVPRSCPNVQQWKKTQVNSAFYKDKLIQYRKIPHLSTLSAVKNTSWKKSVFPTSVAYSTAATYENGDSGIIKDYGLFRYPHIVAVLPNPNKTDAPKFTPWKNKPDPIDIHNHSEIYDNRTPLGVLELILTIFKKSKLDLQKIGFPWNFNDPNVKKLYDFINGQ